MELNTHSQCNSRLCFKVNSGLNIHSKNQWIPNWKRKIIHTHTHTQTHTYPHTKCWYTVHYLVSKFLNSIYWITRLNRPEVTEPQDSLVHSINSQNLNERFSFNDSYAYLNSGYTQWVWNSGYSKKLVHFNTLGVTHTCLNMQTHTHTPFPGAWGEISAIAAILGLPECADTFMSQNNHPT
jgi:hypothetical protein